MRRVVFLFLCFASMEAGPVSRDIVSEAVDVESKIRDANLSSVVPQVEVRMLKVLTCSQGVVTKVSTSSYHPSVIVKRLNTLAATLKLSKRTPGCTAFAKACRGRGKCEMAFSRELQRLQPNESFFARPLSTRVDPTSGIVITSEILVGIDGRDSKNLVLMPGWPHAHRRAVLTALASLHAAFWNARPEEGCAENSNIRLSKTQLRSMQGSTIPWVRRAGRAALAVRLRLLADPMQTMLHADVWPGNVFFTESANKPNEVSAQLYDFESVTRGPPSKDLVLFLVRFQVIGAGEEDPLLEHYYAELCARLHARSVAQPSFEALRQSVDIAFLELHWMVFLRKKISYLHVNTAFHERVRAVIDQLDSGQLLADSTAYARALGTAFPAAKWDYSSPTTIKALHDGLQTLPSEWDVCRKSPEYYPVRVRD